MALILGTLGNDRLFGRREDDVVTGLTGDDLLVGRRGSDLLEGGSGDDMIYAKSRRGDWTDGSVDTVLAGGGDDRVFGAYGDILNGGTGFDRLSLDLSSADEGLNVDFRPMTIVDLLDIVTLRIGTTELVGFQAIDAVIGTEWNDRIVVGNQGRAGADMGGGGGDDRLRATRFDDRVDGDSGADYLVGASGEDQLNGGRGDDGLLGGRGADTLFGGDGADRFVFDEGHSGRKPGRADTILDFDSAEGDRINLRRIDAINGGEDDRFAFIGSDSFSGTAGEVRFVQVGDRTFVRGDTDGDARADFAIVLEGAMDLIRTDFVL